MIKLIFALACLMGGVAPALSALPHVICIGTDPTYAPFSTRNANGQIIGFDSDPGCEICKRMAVKCSSVSSNFDALIPALDAKKIAAILSSLSMAEQRQQETAFSDKRYSANPRLIAVKNPPLRPTLVSLKGKAVSVMQGSAQDAYAKAKWRTKGVDGVAYQNQTLLYSDRASGRLNAAFQDEVAVSEGGLKQPAGKTFAFAGPAVKDQHYFGIGTGVGLRKEDTKLKAAFNQALAELRKNGTYDQRAKKYFNFNPYSERSSGGWRSGNALTRMT